LLERRHAVVAPERLAFEHEERHAEDMILGGFLLAALVGLPSVASGIVEVLLGGETEAADQLRHGLRLVGLEFTKKEPLERLATIVEKATVLPREQPADRCGGRIVDLQRAAYPETARLRPATRVHVGILDLVLGIDAALAFSLEP
jgi:hypothetical protein